MSKQANDLALVDFCAACFSDPLRFVRLAFKWGEGELAGFDGPDKWQADFLEGIKDELSGTCGASSLRRAVASGHGVGKTTLAAWLILWAMSTRPHLSGVVTANTQSQLAGKTWRELSIWHKRLINKDWFKWTASKFSNVQHPETWAVSAVAWNKGSPESFAGLHSEHVLMIFDEASAIDDVIWETAEGAMTTTGAMWFVFGNPTRNTGFFKKCFGRLRHRWKNIRVDSRTALLTNKDEIRKWKEDYGEDSDFFRVRVKGEFPRSASAQLIPEDVIEAAVSRIIPPADIAYAPLIIGVDVARFGEDDSVIAVRQGYKLLLLIRKRGLDTMTLAQLVAQEIDNILPDAVFVDETGIGAGVIDRLHQLGYRMATGVAFSSSPSDRKYFNKRSEMWGETAEWLKNADIPDDRQLIDDLAAPEYGFRGDSGQIQLEKKVDMKKRGLSSPDSGDALALTFAYPVYKRNPAQTRPREINNIQLY